jgi:7-cyano-7-deazaguanine reductase
MEFTSLCPRTGQPDYGSVSIEYVPDGLCIESKSLKYYLWSYRNEGEFCEALAGRIADDIVYAIHPAQLQVEVTQNVRGGIGIVARAVRGSLEP